MKEPTWPARIWSAPFFWRVFILNGLVFVAGVGGLALSPATFAWPLQALELLVLVVGLLVMIAVNAVLLRMGLAPLERLASMMGTIDLLRPGQRLPEGGAAELTPLVRSFNEMLDRLEGERAASTAAALHAQEDERRRVSRELHDEVGQGLTALMLEMSQLNERVPSDLRPRMSHLLEEARSTLADVRRIAQGLRPDVLEELGLTAALSALLSDFNGRTGVAVTRHVEPVPRLSEEAELVIYRIAQESLTNIARHADAARVVFTLLAPGHEAVRLSVVDDGVGVAGPEGGGIRGMRERALLVKGELEITSVPGGGTRLDLVIPLSERDKAQDDDTHAHSPR